MSSHAKIYPEITREYVKSKWQEIEKKYKEFNGKIAGDYSFDNALAEEHRIAVAVEIEPEEDDTKKIMENKEKNINKVVIKGKK
jgi:hypothetical protein